MAEQSLAPDVAGTVTPETDAAETAPTPTGQTEIAEPTGMAPQDRAQFVPKIREVLQQKFQMVDELANMNYEGPAWSRRLRVALGTEVLWQRRQAQIKAALMDKELQGIAGLMRELRLSEAQTPMEKALYAKILERQVAQDRMNTRAAALSSLSASREKAGMPPIDMNSDEAFNWINKGEAFHDKGVADELALRHSIIEDLKAAGPAGVGKAATQYAASTGSDVPSIMAGIRGQRAEEVLSEKSKREPKPEPFGEFANATQASSTLERIKNKYLTTPSHSLMQPAYDDENRFIGMQNTIVHEPAKPGSKEDREATAGALNEMEATHPQAVKMLRERMGFGAKAAPVNPVIQAADDELARRRAAKEKAGAGKSAGK